MPGQKKKWRNLRDPPAQTIQGIILYHDDPVLDARIRQVRMLREDYGYDVGEIAAAIEVGQGQVYAYLQQIQEARTLYIAAFPEEFEGGTEGLKQAIAERRAFDELLRRELSALQNAKNPSDRVGMLKVIMRNMRELEELRGLLIQKVEHAGEVAVKDSLAAALETVPDHVREEYIHALESVIAAAPDPGPYSG